MIGMHYLIIYVFLFDGQNYYKFLITYFFICPPYAPISFTLIEEINHIVLLNRSCYLAKITQIFFPFFYSNKALPKQFKAIYIFFPSSSCPLRNYSSIIEPI